MSVPVKTLSVALVLLSAKSAFAVTLIPADCVVELVRNGVVQERHVGACGYDKPFAVEPKVKMTFRTGTLPGSTEAAPIWHTTDVAPGFHAIVYVGHNISVENPATHLQVRCSIVTLDEVQKAEGLVGDARPVKLEMPVWTVREQGGAGIFKKGDMRTVTGWSDEAGSYEVRIGLH